MWRCAIGTRISPSRNGLISNGYDAAVFRDFKPAENPSGKVLFCYAGTVYAPADPTKFAAALALLPAEVKARMLIRFIGYVENPDYRQMLEAEISCVRLEGFLPQKKALAELQSADFLLLIWNDVINIPGKLFDYLGTGKPIVCFHSAGERGLANHRPDPGRVVRGQSQSGRDRGTTEARLYRSRPNARRL